MRLIKQDTNIWPFPCGYDLALAHTLYCKRFVRLRVLKFAHQLAFLSLPYTHLCTFIDLWWHVVCFSHGFLPRFWHSLHISSHPMIFIVSSVILLSFCAFRILEYLLGYFLEIVCMKIIFCLCVGFILIYLGHLDCYLCFCTTWASNWQLS